MYGASAGERGSEFLHAIACAREMPGNYGWNEIVRSLNCSGNIKGSAASLLIKLLVCISDVGHSVERYVEILRYFLGKR